MVVKGPGSRTPYQRCLFNFMWLDVAGKSLREFWLGKVNYLPFFFLLIKYLI